MPGADSDLKLTIQSRVEELDRVDEAAEAWLGEQGMGDERRDRLVLALREAAANAVVHGNCGEPDGTVEIELARRNSGVLIRVRDSGEGFDPAALPDPLLPENLMRQTGRGILLMRAYADEVEFEFDGGTVATLRCALDDADDPSGGGEE